jgi:hypothetical protein
LARLKAAVCVSGRKKLATKRWQERRETVDTKPVPQFIHPLFALAAPAVVVEDLAGLLVRGYPG